MQNSATNKEGEEANKYLIFIHGSSSTAEAKASKRKQKQQKDCLASHTGKEA
jgi:hypothetical protein